MYLPPLYPTKVAPRCRWTFGIVRIFGGEGSAVVARPGEDVDHRGLRPDRQLQRFGAVDFDNLHPDRADGGVVDVARMRRDDHLVFREPFEVGDANVQIGIAAGHARRRRVRHGRCTARADHAPLGPGQLAESLPDRGHDLVEMRMLLIRRALRRAHLG
jgi:hypothetical protein